MTIHLKDHVTRSKARIIGRTSRTNALDCNPLHLRRNMQLLPHLRSQLRHGQPKLRFLRCRTIAIARNLGLFVELANLHLDRLL
jgi:hypothetical protein